MENKGIASVDELSAAERGKLRYSHPVLTVYGQVKDLTQSAGSANGDAGQGMMPSEPALKENIVQIGEHPLGFGLYLFDYKTEFRTHGEGRQFGVIGR